MTMPNVAETTDFNFSTRLSSIEDVRVFIEKLQDLGAPEDATLVWVSLSGLHAKWNKEKT